MRLCGRPWFDFRTKREGWLPICPCRGLAPAIRLGSRLQQAASSPGGRQRLPGPTAERNSDGFDRFFS